MSSTNRLKNNKSSNSKYQIFLTMFFILLALALHNKGRRSSSLAIEVNRSHFFPRNATCSAADVAEAAEVVAASCLAEASCRAAAAEAAVVVAEGSEIEARASGDQVETLFLGGTADF